MQHGQFIWTDLSSYSPWQARRDYAHLFGWNFPSWGRYRFAISGEEPIAAIFKMPARLAKINMPSFWMSYVQVEDVAASVKKAKAHEGIIIEVKPKLFGKDAKIALVRDPSGTGFTLYEGPSIGGAHSIERYHHVADVTRIKDFYADLFGWSFEALNDKPWPSYAISDRDEKRIATAEQAPEEIRGKYSYWMPCFPLGSKAEFLGNLNRVKGQIVSDVGDGRLMVCDRQQAHFMVRPQA